MSGNAPPMIGPLPRPCTASHAERFAAASRAVVPSLLFGLRLWASVSLALYVAFWLELDNPYWAGTSAAIVCQPQLGASLRKGWFRMIGTVIGAAMSVVLVACFPQDRILFLGGLAVWGAACAFAATLLRNFASYAAALAGYTAAIIAGDLFGAVGGVDANAAFLLAVARATRSASASSAPASFSPAPILAAPGVGWLRSSRICLSRSPPALSARWRRWDEIRRHAVRSSRIRSPRCRPDSRDRPDTRGIGADSLSLAGAAERGGRAVHRRCPAGARSPIMCTSNLLARPGMKPPPSSNACRQNCDRHRSRTHWTRWIGDPVALHKICELTVRRLIALPALTPSMRLLADKSGRDLRRHRACAQRPRIACRRSGTTNSASREQTLRVPDWLPALVNAGRAFVTIGTVALFWIVTAWPGGGDAITFATMFVLLLGPLAEQAYGAAILFTVGASWTWSLRRSSRLRCCPDWGSRDLPASASSLRFAWCPLAPCWRMRGMAGRSGCSPR